MEQSIIDKLPKTKDGIPVIPEVDSVWHPKYGESKSIRFAEYHWLTCSDEKRWWARFRGGGIAVVEICFSTPEACDQSKADKDEKETTSDDES